MSPTDGSGTSDKLQRPWAHEIDSRAVRILCARLPDAWVDRAVSNDYGIDLEVEPFQGGRSLGRLLFLQVKGSARGDFSESPADWAFSMKVGGLRYAELFAVPVLLVVVPTRQDIEPRFLWLQRYIDVVLDFDNPAWREQQTVTLKLPSTNRFPGGESGERRLIHVAAEPQRARQLGRLSHYASEYGWAQARYARDGEIEDLGLMDSLLDEVFKLDMLVGSTGWEWSNGLIEQNVRVPHEVMKKVLSGRALSLRDFRDYAFTDRAYRDNVQSIVDHTMRFRFAEVFTTLLSVVSHSNDVRLWRTNWLFDGSHDF